MLDAGRLDEALAHALGRLLARLGATEVPEALSERLRLYGRLKAELGRAGVAERTGLKEAEVPAFDAALRDVERTTGGAPAATDRGGQERRNAVIARVRLLSWFETVGQRNPALALPDSIETALSEDVGRKQARALELIVRSLVSESYGGQDALVARLREVLGGEVVDKWQAGADADDVLSGATFGELASLFASRAEFDRYERLYADTPFLTLLKQRRKTVTSFLDDVRRIRNVLAHNKRISAVQLALLDLYYEEIVTPVQAAFDHGETRVDPSSYLDASREELDRYFGDLREDLGEVKEELGELRRSVLASLGRVEADTAHLRHATQGIQRRTTFIVAAVVVLLALGAVLLFHSGKTQETAEEARRASEESAGAARDTREAVEQVGRTVEESAHTTRMTAELVDEAAGRMEESADTVEQAAHEARDASAEARDAAQETAEATGRIAQTLEQIRDGFAALSRTGGVIADAGTPQEVYHNARVQEQQGDTANAIASYRRYAAFEGLEFVDPHLRFQSLLRIQGGAAAARETYDAIRRADPGLVKEFAWTLLQDPPARTAALDDIAAAHPDFAPVFYELSREHSAARLGTQALEDKRLEKQALERFLELEQEGKVLRSYLEQSVAIEAVEEARQRLRALSSLAEDVFLHPVTMTATRNNAGWTLVFSIAEPLTVKEVFVRVGTTGDFASTGFFDGMRSPMGLPLPKTNLELADRPATTIQVEYTDIRDRRFGPFDLPFDPDEALSRGMRGMLEMTKTSWLSWRDYDGKVLLYFSQLLSMRAALREIRYGLDRDAPDRTFAFTPADPKNPYAIDTDALIYIEVPEGTRYATVQLTWKDGSKSEVARFDR